MQKLNTQLWNLGTTSFVAALGLSAAACGPVVAAEGETDGGETEGASETIIDPSTPTSPTNPTEPCPMVPCGDDFICETDHCDVYEPYCDEYEDYDCYCSYGHCQPPYDCYDDDECGTGELCQGYDGCDPVQSLSDCGSPAALVGTPLQIPTGNPVGALSFVDLDPGSAGEDLVVGTDIGGWLLPSGGEAVELPSEGAVRGAASADLDGDGTTDLILIDDAGLAVHYGFGTETAQTATLASKQALTAVHALGSIEGLPSVALLDAAGTVSIVAGSSERLLEPTLPRLPSESPAVIASFALGDGSDGMLWDSSGGSAPLLYTLGAQTLDPVGQGPRNGEPRSMAVGALTGSERSDALWASDYGDWTLLEVSIGGQAPSMRAIYFDYDTIAIGDLDGDGNDDALAVGEGGLAVMPGDAEWGLTCFSQSPFVGGASRLVAIGDLDGDGSDEAIVITDAGGAPMQYDVSWTR